MIERTRALLASADAAIDVEDLLKIVLALAAVLLALRVVEELFELAMGLLGPLLVLVVVAAAVLWLLDWL